MLNKITKPFFTILFILSIGNQVKFSQSINFNHLTVENGLSNNKVNDVIQDQFGFIWFGTEDGLNRYDGYEFKIFRNDPEDSTSISDNSIWALTEDSNGNILVGTKAGILNIYNPISEKFIRKEIKSDRSNQNSITALLEDSKGNILVGTRRKGVYKFDKALENSIHWGKDTTKENSLTFFSIRSIIEDTKGNILIGTYKGFNKLNTNAPEKGFQQYYYYADNPNSLSDNQIYNLSRSNIDPNIIWIGTKNGLTKFDSEKNSFTRIEIPNPKNIQFGSGPSTVIDEIINGERYIWTDTYGGLVRMNLVTRESKRFTYNQYDPNSLVSNQINRIFKDKLGIIWIATNNGVSYYAPKSSKFNSVLNSDVSPFLTATINKKDLTAIYKNNSGKIFLGFNNEIISIDQKRKSTVVKNYQKLSNLIPWSFTSRDDNLLWIGSFGQGLKTFDVETDKLKSWNVEHPELTSNAASFIKSLFTDSKGNIWIGFWGLGIAKLTPNNKFIHWTTNPSDNNALTIADVWSIKEDEHGRIWIGTQGGGLNLFEDKDGGIFHHWLLTNDKTNSLSSNVINTINIAQNKNDSSSKSKTILWLGTSNGLNKFEIVNNDTDIYNIDARITSYTVNEGLPDNSVNSIVEDDNGNLWLGTGSGISLFNVNEETFANFSTADGIFGRKMNLESSLKLENGLILFGSPEGLNIFDPKKIRQSLFKPNVVFTDFQIFNKTVKIEKDSPLKKSILDTKLIVLAHEQNVFSIGFAALDYNSSKSIHYAYKMEGFDVDWIKSGKRRFVTYTNLDAGEYTFKVKSTNADGKWNDEYSSLKIIMSQPWWKSSWAYFSYVIMIVIGLFGIRRFEQNRTKLRTELKMREIEADKISELEDLKSRFFANLSHEFRTPLMLIKGPLEQLKINGNNGKYSENIELIERNSDHLKVLIDQLLELSHLESAVIPIIAKRVNIVPTLKGLFASFYAMANQKNIKLKFESDSDPIYAWIDLDKFEKIINNLLSNAVKFADIHGDVKVEIKKVLIEGKEFSQIIISDNGVSIPADKLERIFDRFYQVDNSTQRSYGGSGIGLALVKEFIDLHKWQISVKSEVKTGTAFTLKIPLWDDYLDDNQKVKSAQILENDAAKSECTKNEKLNDDEIKIGEHVNKIIPNDKTSILIVDDSEDVRKYLSNLLDIDYSIFEAENGIDGIELAKEILPDLIISDVMMPSMDGFEFCRIIKSEWQTCDIPVILLTAKALFEDKIEGLEIGADDYLTKPFESIELFTRIKNLLEQKKRILNKYAKGLNISIKKNKISTADDDFIKKTIELVEKNLDNANFGTEQLAKELFVSRTQLHRKMLDITGKAPGEFVRIIKFKHAAQLIIEKRLSITQIAFEIGFSSPAQFTRAFSKHFNCLPSEYLSKQKKL